MEEAPRRSAPPRNDAVISQERFDAYHRFAREKGTSRVLYYIVRAILMPAFLVWLRLQRSGREHARFKGGLIVAANHRSFLDPFVIGALLPWRRRLQFVAKVELFEKRWQGWVLSRLGAFPIRRGQADETAMETAGLIVDRGGTVVIFPEGTRIRTGSLGRPKRGVGRLALETGAAVLPVAVQGSEQVRRGWRIRPRKVRLRAGKPLTFPRTERPSPALAATVTERIWPNIELQWEWLGGLPPLRKAAVIGAGSWGTAVAVLLARGGLEVELGTRTEEKAEKIARDRENAEYLPGVELPDGLGVKRASEIELAGCDLICLAVPSSSLPNVVGSLADRIGTRASVLLLSKGFVQPMGALPNEYVSERVRARALACLGGPAHAREATAGMAALVLGSADPDLRAMLGEVFDRAGLVCERTDDVTGVEVAGASKNAAALAAAAAERIRPQRGRDRCRRRLARVRRVRARPRRPSRDVHRARRGRRPDRDHAGAEEPQPPGRRAARRRRSRGEDPRADRTGLGGARVGAVDRRDGRRGRGRRAQPRGAREPDRGRDRCRRVGRRVAPCGARAKGGLR